MKRYTVYKHTAPNGKVYIGCTSVDAKKRWGGGSSYKKNEMFFKDIVLYGWANIKHEIIATDLARKEAFDLEHQLIIEHKSNQPEYGYNVSSGFGRMGHSITLSDAVKKQIGESRKGKRVGADHPMAKAVYCVELDRVFETGKAAEEATGVNRCHICQVCKGQRKTAGKMHWEYVVL